MSGGVLEHWKGTGGAVARGGAGVSYGIESPNQSEQWAASSRTAPYAWMDMRKSTVGSKTDLVATVVVVLRVEQPVAVAHVVLRLLCDCPAPPAS